MPQQSSTVLFTIFFLRQGKKGWAFRQMGLAKKHFKQQKGLRFGVMLGTGHGRGFSLRPDFGKYALLSSWENPADAGRFLDSSELYQAVKKNSGEIFTVRLQPVMAKGQWHGINPFPSSADAVLPADYGGPVVALTRAGIHWQRLLRFWKHVPAVSEETGQAGGLLAQTGMGEIPVLEQATLSIWEDEKSLTEFAYKMRQHVEVIRKTRSEQWYREELFARFIPVEASGSWNGTNPLAGKCRNDGIQLL